MKKKVIKEIVLRGFDPKKYYFGSYKASNLTVMSDIVATSFVQIVDYESSAKHSRGSKRWLSFQTIDGRSCQVG